MTNTIRKFKIGLALEPLSAAPSGENGQFYFNDTNKTLYSHNGSSWVAVGGGITTYSTVTAAEAANATQDSLIYVADTKTIYSYESSSGVTRDGTFILNTSAAGTTRWEARMGKYIYNELNVATINATSVNTTNLDVAAAETFTQISTPANPAASKNKLYSKSGDKLYTLDSSGNERALVAENLAQNLSNKTFLDAIIQQAISTPSNPSSGYLKVYPKTDGSYYTLNSAGTESLLGASSTNVGEYDFIRSKVVADWTGYDDSASAVPVDGTGGTATGITFAASGSPITNETGVINYRFSKDASNRQGKGYAVTFSTRGDVDKSKVRVLKVKSKSSTNYVDGDVRFFIYDVTNSTLIYPTDYSLKASSGVLNQQFDFQLSATSTSYRLIMHISATHANAFDIDFTIKLVEQSEASSNGITYFYAKGSGSGSISGTSNTFSYGTVVSDTKSGWNSSTNIYTIQENGVYEVVANAYYDNNSSSTLVRTTILLDGSVEFATNYGNLTSTSLNYSANLKNTKYLTKGQTLKVVGGAGTGTIRLNGSDEWLNFSITKINDYNNNGVSNGNSLIGFSAYDTGGTSIAASSTTSIIFDTKEFDYTNSYNNSTGVFTASESGVYLVNSFLHVYFGSAATRTLAMRLYLNGSTEAAQHYQKDTFDTDYYKLDIDRYIYLNKNDTLEIKLHNYSGNTGTLASPSGYNYFSVIKVPQLSQLSSREFVGIYVTQNSGQSITSGSDTTVIYNTEVVDTGNLYDTSTGIFTADRTGYYDINASVQPNFSISSGFNHRIGIYKNNTTFLATFRKRSTGSEGNNNIMVSVNSILLVTGDTIRIKYIVESGGGSGNLDSSAGAQSEKPNWFSVSKVG